MMRAVALFVLLTLPGCKASHVLDDFGEPAEPTPENVKELALLSSTPLVLRRSEMRFSRGVDGVCPREERLEDVQKLTGNGCTETGEYRWLGSATRTAYGGGEFSIVWEHYGYEREVRCDFGKLTEKEMTTGRMHLLDGGVSVDVRFETVNCQLANGETTAFDYTGTFSGDWSVSPAGTWNGAGRAGTSRLGAWEVRTVDEILGGGCEHEAASGTTTLRAGGTEVVITYDGATDCDEESTVQWSLNGTPQGELAGIPCSISPSLMAGLALLLLRRRLHQCAQRP